MWETKQVAFARGHFSFLLFDVSCRLAMGTPNLQTIPKPKEFDVPVTQSPEDQAPRGRRSHVASLRQGQAHPLQPMRDWDSLV